MAGFKSSVVESEIFFSFLLHKEWHDSEALEDTIMKRNVNYPYYGNGCKERERDKERETGLNSFESLIFPQKTTRVQTA